MVADYANASVGLWKNCTGGNCDGSLSYGNEGMHADINA
jgi:hypothetical protein